MFPDPAASGVPRSTFTCPQPPSGCHMRQKRSQMWRPFSLLGTPTMLCFTGSTDVSTRAKWRHESSGTDGGWREKGTSPTSQNRLTTHYCTPCVPAINAHSRARTPNLGVCRCTGHPRSSLLPPFALATGTANGVMNHIRGPEGTAVEGVGGTCGSRGGMVSWPRSWHTPCRAWYWFQATRSLRSTRIVRGIRSHGDCGMRRQETWCRSAADALFHHSVTVSCHGPQVLSHMLRNATFQRMQWMSYLWTAVPWWRGHMGHLGLVWSHGAPVPSHRT